MSTIKKRTWYVDTSKDQVRFWDFCTVVTSKGTMVEPRQLNRVASSSPDWQTINPQDELSIVHALEPIDILKQKANIFGTGLHGGEQLPTSYHYNPVNE